MPGPEHGVAGLELPLVDVDRQRHHRAPQVEVVRVRQDSHVQVP